MGTLSKTVRFSLYPSHWVPDVGDEDRVGNSLLQIQKLRFGLVILVVQPSGRLVNSLDRIDGGLQMMDSRFCGPLSALDRVTLSVLFLQQFQPSTGRHQAYTDHS